MLTEIWYQIWHNSHHHYSQLCNGARHVQRQETSRKAHQCNKTAQRVQNSSERSTRQRAQDLYIPHRIVCMVLHQLLPARWTVAVTTKPFVTSSPLIMIFPRNKPVCVCVCVCVPTVLRKDNPELNDSYLSTLHSPQVTCCKCQTPKQLAHQTHPKFTLPRHVSRVVHRTENTDVTELWQNVTAATSTAMDTLQCTIAACQWNVAHATKRAHDKVHRLRTQIKPASTLSNATYVLNMFIETATCFS